MLFDDNLDSSEYTCDNLINLNLLLQSDLDFIKSFDMFQKIPEFADLSFKDKVNKFDEYLKDIGLPISSQGMELLAAVFNTDTPVKSLLTLLLNSNNLIVKGKPTTFLKDNEKTDFKQLKSSEITATTRYEWNKTQEYSALRQDLKYF